jgi:hypothetical protein
LPCLSGHCQGIVDVSERGVWMTEEPQSPRSQRQSCYRLILTKSGRKGTMRVRVKRDGLIEMGSSFGDFPSKH